MIKGEVIYLHCWGGHGRTGLVASIIIGLIYAYTPEKCMQLVQTVHDCRLTLKGVSSPNTLEQREQVIRVLQMEKAQRYTSMLIQYRSEL